MARSRSSREQRASGGRFATAIGRHWRKVVGGLVTLIVAPVAVTLISNALGGEASPGATTTKLGADLQVDKIVVRNPKYDTVPGTAVVNGVRVPGFKQTQGSMPRAVLTVSNTGNRRAILTGLVFTVRDYAQLKPCQAGAATQLEGDYQVRLPVPARRGQPIALDVDRNIAPDGVDRFALRFAPPFDALNLGGEYLYVLDVAAKVSRTPQAQRIGTIAISAPGVPKVDELKGSVPGEALPQWLVACYQGHRRDLRRIANYPGAIMDPALRAVDKQSADIEAGKPQ